MTADMSAGSDAPPQRPANAEVHVVCIQGDSTKVVVVDSTTFLMPDVSSDRPSPEEAAKRLVDAGWSGSSAGQLNVTEKATPASDWGRVISQSPTKDEKAPKLGRPTVAVGVEPTFPMPDLEGMTQQQARDALAGLDFRGRITVQALPNTDPALAGKVADAQPAVGSIVKITGPATMSVYAVPPPTSSTQSSGVPKR